MINFREPCGVSFPVASPPAARNARATLPQAWGDEESRIAHPPRRPRRRLSRRNSESFLDARREASPTRAGGAAIIADVAAARMAALIALTLKFDRVDHGTIGMRGALRRA
jgi:hypothetical protein